MLKDQRKFFALAFVAIAIGAVAQVALQSATEAPTGFSTPTLSENPGSLSEGNGMPFPAGQTMADVQAVFEEQDGVDEGLGPVYNAQSCVNCHQNPVTGGGSQVSELRVGHRDRNGRFVNPTVSINNGANSIVGRSLINDRATCAEAQERVSGTEDLRTFRMSLNVLGDGFIEAIDSNTLLNIANTQRGHYPTAEFQASSSRCRYWKLPATIAAAGSDGKTSTQACFRSRPTPM